MSFSGFWYRPVPLHTRDAWDKRPTLSRVKLERNLGRRVDLRGANQLAAVADRDWPRTGVRTSPFTGALRSCISAIVLTFFPLLRHQRPVFNQPTELLLRYVMVRSFSGLQVCDRFVFHFQSLEIHDTQIFVSDFPDLSLLQLEHRARLNESAAVLNS